MTTTLTVYQQPKYVRLSSSSTLVGTEDYVELDTDSGLPFVLTLPALPSHLYRVEIWLTSQPGGPATIDPNGQRVTLAPNVTGLVLSAANEGRVLLYVKPTLLGAGYWRVSNL
jgi:hypothetical protein